MNTKWMIVLLYSCVQNIFFTLVNIWRVTLKIYTEMLVCLNVVSIFLFLIVTKMDAVWQFSFLNSPAHENLCRSY